MVDKLPTKAGIDPLNKLIDRNPEDNVVKVEKKVGSVCHFTSQLPSGRQETVRASMSVARKMRLVEKRSKFVAGEFLIDFCDLRREAIIRARTAIADKACDLALDFSIARIDSILALVCSGGNVGQKGTHLLTERLKECLLVV